MTLHLRQCLIRFSSLAVLVSATYAQAPPSAVPPSSASMTGAAETSPPSSSSPAPVDNTKINKRDRNAASVTPTKQSDKREDLKIEAAVRRAVVRDKSLSSMAHNIKIVTRSGVVTLRGPVKTSQESDKIIALAQQTPGVVQVENQLDVKHP